VETQTIDVSEDEQEKTEKGVCMEKQIKNPNIEPQEALEVKEEELKQEIETKEKEEQLVEKVLENDSEESEVEMAEVIPELGADIQTTNTCEQTVGAVVEPKEAKVVVNHGSPQPQEVPELNIGSPEDNSLQDAQHKDDRSDDVPKLESSVETEDTEKPQDQATELDKIKSTTPRLLQITKNRPKGSKIRKPPSKHFHKKVPKIASGSLFHAQLSPRYEDDQQEPSKPTWGSSKSTIVRPSPGMGIGNFDVQSARSELKKGGKKSMSDEEGQDSNNTIERKKTYPLAKLKGTPLFGNFDPSSIALRKVEQSSGSSDTSSNKPNKPEFMNVKEMLANRRKEKAALNSTTKEPEAQLVQTPQTTEPTHETEENETKQNLKAMLASQNKKLEEVEKTSLVPKLDLKEIFTAQNKKLEENMKNTGDSTTNEGKESFQEKRNAIAKQLEMKSKEEVSKEQDDPWSQQMKKQAASIAIEEQAALDAEEELSKEDAEILRLEEELRLLEETSISSESDSDDEFFLDSSGSDDFEADGKENDPNYRAIEESSERLSKKIREAAEEEEFLVKGEEEINKMREEIQVLRTRRNSVKLDFPFAPISGGLYNSDSS